MLAPVKEVATSSSASHPHYTAAESSTATASQNEMLRGPVKRWDAGKRGIQWRTLSLSLFEKIEGNILSIILPLDHWETFHWTTVCPLKKEKNGRKWMHCRDTASIPMHCSCRAGITCMAICPKGGARFAGWRDTYLLLLLWKDVPPLLGSVYRTPTVRKF